VSVALWVALGAGAATGKINVSDGHEIWLKIGLFVFVLGHAVFWVRYNWTRNQRDLIKAFDYLKDVHIRLSIKDLPPPPDSRLQKWLHKNCRCLEFLVAPPCVFEILISVLVTFFVFMNLHHPI
jgi:hypothetical protein